MIYDFGFKERWSTTMHKYGSRNITAYYFNHEGSNVYDLSLDVGKVIDRVNYFKLFKILLHKGIFPMLFKLL